MSAELDELDHAILEILKKDSRKSFTEIGSQLNLSEGAIRRRVKSLIERGVIKAFTIEVERGHHVRAFTFLSVDPSVPTPKVADALTKIAGVETVYEITGEYDAVALISVPSMQELNKCIEAIRNIEGIRDTNTIMILRQLRGS
ncbi:MAG: Lrp/AsnC family transcriptional regulator [Aigarchaeota archaeon]|nr:Lrp/AsnC family transcriptional regulator [Candidatus Pelearchaeum maunauluense]